ncbi:MAG: 50S ribosomal protein L19, partial [Candidatus Kapaibacterium sp.]
MHPKVQMIEQMTIANMHEVRKTKDGDNARAIPSFGPGDTVTVAVRVVEGEKERCLNFSGICIAGRGGGAYASGSV